MESLSEEVRSRIVEYMDAVESSVATAEVFVSSNAPLVAQEYLALVYWKSLIGLVFCLVVVVSAVFVSRAAAISARKPDDEENEGLIIFSVFYGVLGGGICAIMTVVNAICFIEVSVAPRIVLLEKISQLIN